MKPIKNQILFKPFLVNEKTEGGLFVPESFRTDSDRGEIVAVGKGTKDNPMKLKKGAIAYRVHNWGTLIQDKGENFYLMEDSAILATE
jgi:chaperonin GroES